MLLKSLYAYARQALDYKMQYLTTTIISEPVLCVNHGLQAYQEESRVVLTEELRRKSLWWDETMCFSHFHTQVQQLI